MRNIPWTRDEVIAQLKNWDRAKRPMRLLFSNEGLSLCIPCNIRFLEGDDLVILLGGNAEIIGRFLVVGNSFPKAVPLLDASEELRWKLDFFLGVEFKLPCGIVGLYEVAQ